MWTLNDLSNAISNNRQCDDLVFWSAGKYTLCYKVSWLCSVSCKEMHIGGPRSRKLVRHPPCLKCSATCSHCGIVCCLFIIAIYRPSGGDDETRLIRTLHAQEKKNTRLLESSQSVKQEDRFQASLCSLQLCTQESDSKPNIFRGQTAFQTSVMKFVDRKLFGTGMWNVMLLGF